MSKMDNLRAMREARYAESQARAKAHATSGSATPAPARTARQPTAPTRPDPGPSADPTEATETTEPTESLCGHRNMSGRTCTREAGHAAKSHRYS